MFPETTHNYFPSDSPSDSPSHSPSDSGVVKHYPSDSRVIKHSQTIDYTLTWHKYGYASAGYSNVTMLFRHGTAQPYLLHSGLGNIGGYGAGKQTGEGKGGGV
jgi:hypothetical protein